MHRRSATSPHLIATSPHLIATSPHLIATSPHLIATSPHLIATSMLMIATLPHLIATLLVISPALILFCLGNKDFSLSLACTNSPMMTKRLFMVHESIIMVLLCLIIVVE